MNHLRRLRALFGLALAWGIAWIPLGILVSSFDLIMRGQPLSIARMSDSIPILAGVGAFCGFAFGLVLAAMERKHSFAGLSLGRTIAWGVVASLIIPMTASLVASGSIGPSALSAIAIYGVLGGISAGYTLRIARRAPVILPKGEAQAPVIRP